jgi:hypothetical protein
MSSSNGLTSRAIRRLEVLDHDRKDMTYSQMFLEVSINLFTALASFDIPFRMTTFSQFLLRIGHGVK